MPYNAYYQCLQINSVQAQIKYKFYYDKQ
jgi:hypothetical protein